LRRTLKRNQAMGDVVLIADNDEDIVYFVALNLRLEGFDVVAAHDGQEALTKALDMQPSLILLDTTMPRMDGYEVRTKLRGDECGRTIPVIMLTANSLKADRALALTVGADDWVTKPFDPAELPRRKLNAGLAGERLPRSGMVRISSYFRSL
jgi:DNA-binding response OmpR family regulator